MPRHSCLVAVLLAACAGGGDAVSDLVTIDTLPGGIPQVVSSAPVEPGQWSLVHERDVQPAEEAPGELLSPEDVALADDGTLYVVESSPIAISVYRPDGSYLRTIGRSGGGPGEYNSAWIALRGDTLAVQDPGQSRGTTIDLSTDSVISIRPTACCYWHPIGIDGSGRAVARAISESDDENPTQPFIRFTMQGSTTDTVAIQLRPPLENQKQWVLSEGGRVMGTLRVPLQPFDVIAIDPLGEFITGWSGEYRMALTDGHDTTLVFGRNWTPAPVSSDEKRTIVAKTIAGIVGRIGNFTEPQLREALDPGAIPDQRPAFLSIWSDRTGRRWIQQATADTLVVTLDLFDTDGRWLDQVSVPGHLWSERVAFSRDRVAVVDEDDDGLPLVRILRVERR